MKQTHAHSVPLSISYGWKHRFPGPMDREFSANAGFARVLDISIEHESNHLLPETTHSFFSGRHLGLPSYPRPASHPSRLLQLAPCACPQAPKRAHRPASVHPRLSHITTKTAKSWPWNPNRRSNNLAHPNLARIWAMAMGQNPNRSPSEHQPIPTKIGSKMGGAPSHWC